MKNEEQNQQEEPEVSENKEQEYLEGWKRARADLENVQKRMNDTRMQERAMMKRKVAEPLIILADNFRSLLEHAPDTKDPWTAGVLHVARQFDQILEEFGVEQIQETGIVFDPAIHEAIAEVEVESESESGKVKEIVQVGYKIGDITVRPAKVKVTAWQSSRPVSRDPGDPLKQPAGVDSGSPLRPEASRGAASPE